MMNDSTFIVNPQTLDYSIQNFVNYIEKGFSLHDLSVEEAKKNRLELVDAIILKPDYQREYRSTVEEESSLIESVLLGIPIPPIFLCSTKMKNVQVLNVVDGQHRLYAFYRFRKGEFKLSGLPLLKDYNGLSFDQLEEEDQDRIITHKLTAYVFRDFPGKKYELEVFNRYNKGTKNLTPQEIRNAVYSSPHNDYVNTFVESLYLGNNQQLKDVYNVTKDRFLKKKVHEGIFSIFYVLEFGIQPEFKDSTTYATEYMKLKAQLVEDDIQNKTALAEEDAEKQCKNFEKFNEWILKCTQYTQYPFSKELYGISSKRYKFQTSMALILTALYKKLYVDNKTCLQFPDIMERIIDSLNNSFLENPDYTASSTNSREIEKFINSFDIS